MAVSKDGMICPYCKFGNLTNDMIGGAGLINYRGTERTFECKKCGEQFVCEMIVDLKFKTFKLR